MKVEIILPLHLYCDNCPLFDCEYKRCRLAGKRWVADPVEQPYPKNFLRPKECIDENGE